MASRTLAAVLTAAVATGAAAAFALYPRPEPLREGATITPLPSITAAVEDVSTAAPGASSTPSVTGSLSAQDSVAALCAVRTSAVTGLLGGATGTARFEALRDAVPALSERMADVQAAANGQPSAQPVLAVVEGVYKDWSKALNLHDSGSDITGGQSLTSAATKIKTLDPAILQALPTGTKC